MSAYTELKFRVSSEQLTELTQILDMHYAGSDPFPEGTVDSVYFDTHDLAFFEECLSGSFEKLKCRIRGYGDGSYAQAQLKRKLMYEVHKMKTKIEPVRLEQLNDWTSLKALDPIMWQNMLGESLGHGPLFPMARIRYQRRRYRAFDFRLTLDYAIEASAVNGTQPWVNTVVRFPEAVLELKSYQKRPHIPLLGAMKLQQISFSKYMLGIQYLRGDTLVLKSA